MDYPSYTIDHDSYEFMPMDGSQSSRADGGALRIRRLWSTTRYSIKFIHPSLSQAEWNTLLATYQANLGATLNFVEPGSANIYTVLWIKPPMRRPGEGGWGIDAAVELEGTLVDA